MGPKQIQVARSLLFRRVTTMATIVLRNIQICPRKHYYHVSMSSQTYFDFVSLVCNRMRSMDQVMDL